MAADGEPGGVARGANDKRSGCISFLLVRCSSEREKLLWCCVVVVVAVVVVVVVVVVGGGGGGNGDGDGDARSMPEPDIIPQPA